MMCLFPLNTEHKCTEVLEGQSYTMKLDSPEITGDSLVWKCDDNVVYNRKRNGKIATEANVDNKGSLTLTNISKSNACTYKAEHYDKMGKVVKIVKEMLCVFCKYNTVKKINSQSTINSPDTLCQKHIPSFHILMTKLK